MKEKFKNMSFSAKIIIASLLGVAVGLILGEYAGYLKIFGDIFINLISVMVPFLIFGAIAEAVMSLDFKSFGSVGIKTILSFVVTSLLAAVIGISLAVLLKPGLGVSVPLPEYTGNSTGMSAYDAILGFFPKNFFAALTNNNVVQILVFAMIVGLSISYWRESSPVMQKTFNLIQDFNVFVMKTVTLIMNLAPIGIFAIVARMFGVNGLKVLVPLAKFVGTNTLANILIFTIFGLVICSTCRLNFLRFMKNCRGTIVMAASTTSSAMSMPTNIREAVENQGISKRISKFVIPLGCTLNTDGGVALTTMASIMVTQMLGIEMSVSAMISLAVSAVMSSFANTMVPGGGIVAMAIVFEMNGIPLEALALFAGIDWFVAITRVVVNIVDDMLCALFVAVTEKELDRDVFYGRKKVTYDDAEVVTK